MKTTDDVITENEPVDRQEIEAWWEQVEDLDEGDVLYGQSPRVDGDLYERFSV